MNSYILKGQRDSFSKSCDEYLGVHQVILSKMAEIGSLLYTSIDTLSIEYINSINEAIIKEILKLNNYIINSKDKTLRVIDKTILELEEREKEASLKNKT